MKDMKHESGPTMIVIVMLAAAPSRARRRGQWGGEQEVI
jgi:hypothetical protein